MKSERRFVVKKALILLGALLIVTPLFAQGGAPGPGFNFAAGLGTDLLPNPSTGNLESWSKLAFQPELSIGKFGIGLDLMLRFKLASDGSTGFQIYEPDWIPQNGKTIFDVYLPKILYVRYGTQWEDPFYIKMGSISDFTLGNGLIINNYSNMQFLPTRRIFGIQAGLDGSLFGVPYIGVEALTGNVTKLDVIGGRVYVKPLAFMSKSFLGRLQVGATGVYDKDPLIYTGSPYSSVATRPIYVVGADVTLPLIQSPVFSLTPFAEGAREMNSAMGAIAGIRGNILKFLAYGAQFRYFQDDFIPSYFDANYDRYRADRFVYIETHNPAGSNYNPSWLGMLGFDLFKSTLSFRASFDAPFSWVPATPSDNSADYPHVVGTLNLARGLIPNVSIAAKYEKFFLGKTSGGNVLSDLIDLTNASIGMTVSYKAGSAIVGMNYSYIWNPTKSSFDVVSSLSVGFEL